MNVVERMCYPTKIKKAIGITYMENSFFLQEYGIKVRGHKELISYGKLIFYPFFFSFFFFQIIFLLNGACVFGFFVLIILFVTFLGAFNCGFSFVVYLGRIRLIKN